MRVHDVVLDFHDLTLSGAHQGCSLVAVAELGTGLASLLLHPFTSVGALGVHGHEGGEAVAAVDIHGEGHRAEAVSGIDIATVVTVVLHAPTELRLVSICGVLPVVIPEVVEVVDVGTFATEHFAKDTVLRHIQGVELIPVVAAVLENHAVLASLLTEFDELPALCQVHGRGHLDGGVLAVLQRALSHGEVVVPVGGDIDEVDVGALAELLIALLAAIDGGRGKTCIAEILLAAFSTCLHIVAEGNNLHTGDIGPALHSTGTAHAETHEGHTHRLQLRSRELQHIRLPGRALRCVNHNGSLLPVPILIGHGERLSASCHSHTGDSDESKKFLHAVVLWFLLV